MDGVSGTRVLAWVGTVLMFSGCTGEGSDLRWWCDGHCMHGRRDKTVQVEASV